MKSILSFVVALVFCQSSFANLVVFYPSSYTVKDRQAVYSKAIDTTVVAKYRDFEGLVKSGSFSGVIAPPTFKAKGLTKVGTLQVNGKSDFKYLIFSLDKKWSLKNLAKGKLGYVAFGKKKDDQKFLKESVGLDFKRVKSVSKLEDLVPLLVFGSVDFIIVPDYDYKVISGNIKVDLNKIGDSKGVALPQVYAKPDQVAKVQGLLKLPAGALQSIGISSISGGK